MSILCLACLYNYIWHTTVLSCRHDLIAAKLWLGLYKLWILKSHRQSKTIHLMGRRKKRKGPHTGLWFLSLQHILLVPRWMWNLFHVVVGVNGTSKLSQGYLAFPTPRSEDMFSPHFHCLSIFGGNPLTI